MVSTQNSSDEDRVELQATSGSSTSFSSAKKAPSPSPRKAVPDAVVRAPPGLKLEDGAPGRMVVIRDQKQS